MDRVVRAFAIWTVLSHGAVALGLGLDPLIAAAGAAALVGVGLAVRGRGRRTKTPPLPLPDPVAAGARGLALAGAAGVAVAFAAGAPVGVVWGGAALLCLALVGRELLALAPAGAAAAPADASPDASRVLAAFALLCALLVLASHRPDADDAFYLNLAVTAADHPSAPLLAADGLHGVPGTPLTLPVYRVHAYETAIAAIARVTGLEVLDVAHLLLPPLVALLVPFAWARLMRQLAGREWLVATGLALLFVAFGSASSHGWTAFGFERLHQGKAILLTLALPWVAATALAWRADPSPARWASLFAAQVAAVGLSASALWLAPAVAGTALLAGGATGASRPEGLRSIVRGLAASLYPLAVAGVVRGATAAAFRDAAAPPAEAGFASARLAAQALESVLGGGAGAALALGLVLAAWAAGPSPVARRFASGFALAGLVLWNPLVADWIAANVTGTPTYWRVLWLWPAPALVGLALAAPLAHPRLGGGWRRGVAVACAALLVVAAGGASTRALAWRTPGWQIPDDARAAATALVAAAGPGATVVAPRRVAPWVVALRDHPHPVVVRSVYLPILEPALGSEALRRRLVLMRLASGERRPPLARETLRDATADPDLRAICFSRAAMRWGDLVALVEAAGFLRVHEDEHHVVWGRTGAPVVASPP